MPGVMQDAKLVTGAQLAMPSRGAKWPFSSLACLPGTLPGRSSLSGLPACRLTFVVDVPECHLPGSAVAQSLLQLQRAAHSIVTWCTCCVVQARATHGTFRGCYYYEVKVTHLGSSGHARVGWATRKGELQAPVRLRAPMQRALPCLHVQPKLHASTCMQDFTRTSSPLDALCLCSAVPFLSSR